MPHQFVEGENLWEIPDFEVAFPNWSALVAALTANVPPGWIFRGQRRAERVLESKIVRILQDSLWPNDRWEMAERSAIGYFKQHAKRQLPDPPEERDLIGWLSTMQHYGAPTRLLDWTASPFVAAYFALENAKHDEDAALWALHAVYCRIANSDANIFPYDELGTFPSFGLPDPDVPRFLSLEITRSEVENRRLRSAIYRRSPWPLPLLPHVLDARMAAQQAVLTAVGELRRPVDALAEPVPEAIGTSIFHRIAGHTDGQPDAFFATHGLPNVAVTEKRQIIRKIILRGEWRREALGALDRMGITRETLFPGLDGIGAATTHHLERPHQLRDLLAPGPTEVDLGLPGASL